MKTTDLIENLREWQKQLLKEQHHAALSVGAAIGKIEELLSIVKRARDMIDVSPEDHPSKWPSTGQINQLVKECDDILPNAQGHL